MKQRLTYMQTPSIPTSTYRLQFHHGFTFRDAAAIVPYLAELGVSHVYASPYLKATAGSLHGYDVVDHCRLNPELGTDADFDAMNTALAKHEMGLILDVVPNHVGIATNDNKWWNSVLAEGEHSKYGRFFDIAWNGSPREELHGKVLLPLLGGLYNEVLEKGELTLSYHGGGFWVNYFDRQFPIAKATLPLNPGDDPQEIVRRMNGKPGDPKSFDRLHSLLEQQHYRLAYWKNASDEINYRRFFDVNDLAALAMERQEVFDDTHALIFQLIDEGKVTGLRLDHPDGLYNPAEYFQRLQNRFRKGKRLESSEPRPLYLLAEKILAMEEDLPEHWQIHGTSGYDFLNVVNGLFVDAANEQAFSNIYTEWLGEEAVPEYQTLIYEKKKLILQISLKSELHMLAHRLDRIAQRHREWRDFTLDALMHGLEEVIASFAVYRTYIDCPDVSAVDQREITRAIDAAVARNSRTDISVFHFIRDVLLQTYPRASSSEEQSAQLALARKFQQLTSPTTAKGIEDTSFYIYNRFISLNEVGGDPSHFGVSAEQLHAYLAKRQMAWPGSMSTLSTHDTKRSEDVRARLNVLSELPGDWQMAINRWREINKRHKTIVDGQPAPDSNDEYFLYQALLGAWPLEPWSAEEYDTFRERMQAYMLKAIREAKVHTVWTSPNEAYHDAVNQFVARLLNRTTGGEFLDDFSVLRKRISAAGLLNSLSQTLLKLTAPGVPDTYQGTELWDFSLVDPDNRRPVDYEKRKAQLDFLSRSENGPNSMNRADLASDLAQHLTDGGAKLLVVSESLKMRCQHPALFTHGQYLPLNVRGPRAAHVFAFLRRTANATALVVVPRLVRSVVESEQSLDDFWQDTVLVIPPNVPPLTNVFTGEALEKSQTCYRVAEIFSHFPVVLALSDRKASELNAL